MLRLTGEPAERRGTVVLGDTSDVEWQQQCLPIGSGTVVAVGERAAIVCLLSGEVDDGVKLIGIVDIQFGTVGSHDYVFAFQFGGHSRAFCKQIERVRISTRHKTGGLVSVAGVNAIGICRNFLPSCNAVVE